MEKKRSGEGESMMETKRRRVAIEKIEDVNKRQVTFSKRRRGLFKKASELCTFSGADLAVIAFSPAGNPFAFGNPNVDAVIDSYLGKPAEQQPEVHVAGEGNNTEEKSGFWWDRVDPGRVNDAGELQIMVTALEEARAKVLARADELAAATAATPSESKTEIVSAYDALRPLENLESYIAPPPSEYDLTTTVAADQILSTISVDNHEDDGDLYDVNRLWSLLIMNPDDHTGELSKYDNIPTTSSDDDLQKITGGDRHDGVFNDLPPLVNLYSNIAASISEYDTVVAAAANFENGVLDGLFPINLASPRKYDTIPVKAADDGHSTKSGGDGYDGVFDGLSPLRSAPWSDWSSSLSGSCF